MSAQTEARGYPVSKCSSCGSYLVTERPSPTDTAEKYDQLFTGEGYAQLRAQFEQIRDGKFEYSTYRKLMLKQVEGMVAGRNLTEIGGGTGAFGYLAKHRGWNYVDYDVSKAAVDYARQLDLTAHVFPPEQIPPLPEQSADAVVMWEVIEHVWDVRGYLETILNALKQDGVFFLSTPTADRMMRGGSLDFDGAGQAAAPPIHINFFTHASLGIALENAGFSHAKIWQRRLVTPDKNLRSIWHSFMMLMRLHPAPTICATARR